jgi:CHASE2 domain-containing sensor protein
MREFGRKGKGEGVKGKGLVSNSAHAQQSSHDLSKRAVLRCDGGLEQGFRVTLEISEGNAPVFTEATGGLPAARELLQLFTQWQQDYYQSLGVSRIALESISVQTGTLTQIETCRNSERQLKTAIQAWLAAPEFQPIEQRLREILMPQEAVEILLRTTDPRLHRLPWHFWDFIDRYPQAELVVSSPSERIVLPARAPNRVRILAILGDRRGIDTEADRVAISAVPDADVVFLVEPTRQQVYDQLWEETWDLLFFAGHSSSEQQQGRLYLNPTESLTLEELRFGLQRAIARGLQLTIFNSCDGLGLAYELERLHVPQSIVMREPVPDRVAQEFLKRFLNTFATGASLHTSVRQARESLQGLEGEFPAASWLPIVFQNPAVPSLTWKGLQGYPAIDAPKSQPLVRTRSTLRQRIQLAIATSLAVTGCVTGIRHLGLFQPWELSALDLLMRSRLAEQPDPRIAIVTVTEADLQTQTYENEPRRGSLSDRSLKKLLAKLTAAGPIAIGLDIYRDYPVSKSEPDLDTALKTSDRLVGVCKVSEAESGDPGVAPPPELTAANLGFSDVLLDPDRLVRRHYLSLQPAPSSPCQAGYALSVQLALRYLATKGIGLEFPDRDIWKLGKLTFPLRQAHSGGYQHVESSGHQILLNYRATPTPMEIAPRVTLKEVLDGRIGKDTFKDKIVLIGTTAPSFHDSLSIPYPTDHGEIQSMPGVVIQAQMVSQLISAAIDGRPLIHSSPLWVDVLWIWGVAVSGGLLVCTIHRPLYLGLAGAVAILTISGTCLWLLQSGYWVPFVPAAIAIVGTGSMTKLVDRSMNHEI